MRVRLSISYEYRNMPSLTPFVHTRPEPYSLSNAWDYDEPLFVVTLAIEYPFLQIERRDSAERGIDEIDVFQHACIQTPLSKNIAPIRAFALRGKNSLR